MRTNYVHAVVGTATGLVGLAAVWHNAADTGTFDIVWSSSDSVPAIVAWTCGYLVVDLATSVAGGLLATDTHYVAFHAGILVAFALFLANGSGAVASLVGLVGELYTVVMHHHEALYEWLLDRHYAHSLARRKRSDGDRAAAAASSSWAARCVQRCDELLVRHMNWIIEKHEQLVDLSFMLSRWLPCLVVCLATCAHVGSIVRSPVLLVQFCMMLALNALNTRMFVLDFLHYTT